MPPTTYMRSVLPLPYQAWGELDLVLTQARRRHSELVCRCCGQWAPDAHNEDTDGEWTVDDSVVCVAGATMQRWQLENPPEKREPGVLPLLVHLTEDEWERVYDGEVELRAGRLVPSGRARRSDRRPEEPKEADEAENGSDRGPHKEEDRDGHRHQDDVLTG